MHISYTLLTMEEELSLAYIHAICARADMSCIKAERALDNDGIDVLIKARFPGATYPQMEDCHLEVQMKATRNEPDLVGDCYDYWLQGHKRYEKLRNTNRELCRILAVLFLPKDEKDWLEHSEQQLIMRRCVYWAYLGGAPAVATSSGARVALPQDQFLDPAALQFLMRERSFGRDPVYHAPGANP